MALVAATCSPGLVGLPFGARDQWLVRSGQRAVAIVDQAGAEAAVQNAHDGFLMRQA